MERERTTKKHDVVESLEAGLREAQRFLAESERMKRGARFPSAVRLFTAREMDWLRLPYHGDPADEEIGWCSSPFDGNDVSDFEKMLMEIDEFLLGT